MKQNVNRPEYSDINYGVTSIAITTTGINIVATTGGYYHGISMVAGSEKITMFVYDNASGTTGNLLDAIVIRQGGDRQGERFIPILAKNGIVLGVTGSQGKGVLFFGPKG